MTTTTSTMSPAVDVVTYTSHEIMRLGLNWTGYDRYRQGRVQHATNIARFQSHYGSTPVVCAQIWEDLQTTEIPEARVERKHLDLKYFLCAMNFLFRYETDEELSGKFTRCSKSLRNWKWFYVGKVAALKGKKVSL